MHMAQILSFRTPELRNDPSACRQDGRGAEVIPFPGVRYERWDDGSEASVSDDRRARRDVIELADQ
jgi:hypothetical protein